MHIARSSSITYASSHRTFLQFCEIFDLDPWRVTEDDLCLAAVHFCTGHTVRSARSYFSAIQNLWTAHGVGTLPRNNAYTQTIQGLDRLLGTADVVIRSKALAPGELIQMIEALDPLLPVDVVFACECMIAFFLCLRTEDHVCGRLKWGHVFIQPDRTVEFLIPPGKKVRYYRHVALAARDDALDLVLWLDRLAAIVPLQQRGDKSPLFVLFVPRRGETSPGFWAITRPQFINRFKDMVRDILGFDPTLYAGYSLRRGGVTELVQRCSSLPIIKRHVGWSANSTTVYDYYDHSGKEQMLRPTLLMGRG